MEDEGGGEDLLAESTLEIVKVLRCFQPVVYLSWCSLLVLREDVLYGPEQGVLV